MTHFRCWTDQKSAVLLHSMMASSGAAQWSGADRSASGFLGAADGLSTGFPERGDIYITLWSVVKLEETQRHVLTVQILDTADVVTVQFETVPISLVHGAHESTVELGVA